MRIKKYFEFETEYVANLIKSECSYCCYGCWAKYESNEPLENPLECQWGKYLIYMLGIKPAFVFMNPTDWADISEKDLIKSLNIPEDLIEI